MFPLERLRYNIDSPLINYLESSSNNEEHQQLQQKQQQQQQQNQYEGYANRDRSYSSSSKNREDTNNQKQKYNRSNQNKDGSQSKPQSKDKYESKTDIKSYTDLKSQTDSSVRQEKPAIKKRTSSIPLNQKKQAKSKLSVAPILSSDTDEHLCEDCYMDKISYNFQKQPDQDSMSDCSNSSWDSDCARIYAEVACKEVFDPSKLQKIINTKVYKEEKMFQQMLLNKSYNDERSLINISNQQISPRHNRMSGLQQQQFNSQQQQQQKQKQKSSIRQDESLRKVTIQDDNTQHSASFMNTSLSQKGNFLIDKKQQNDKSSSHIQSKTQLKKRTMSDHSIHVVDQYNSFSNVLSTRKAPQMEPLPKDKYKIQELVEEMIKQNNRIYKAELQRDQQEKIEEKEREQQRKENLKKRLKFIQEKHRLQYYKHLENNQINDLKVRHDYQWGLDQRKFNPQQQQQVDSIPMTEVRQQKRQEKNIDKYFSEFIDRVQQKIKKRKQILKQETLQISKKSKELFSQQDAKEQEKKWNHIEPKELKQKQLEQNQFITQKEQEQKTQCILEERKQKYQSANKRTLSTHDNDQIKLERGKRALSQLKKEKKKKENDKKVKNQKLQQLQEKAKEQLEKAKKSLLSKTLSEMNFDLSENDNDNNDNQAVNKENQKKSIKNNLSKQPVAILIQKTKPQKEISFKKETQIQKQNQPLKQQTSKYNQNEQPRGELIDQKNKRIEKDISQEKQNINNNKSKKEQQPQKGEIIRQKVSNKQFEIHDQSINEIVIDEEQYEMIQQKNQEQHKNVTQIVGGMNLSNVKLRSDWTQPPQKASMKDLRNQSDERDFKDSDDIGNKMQFVNNQELPDDFIEKIFTTAEMHDLPKEYVLAQENKDSLIGGNNRFKQFEREIQNELYKKNEKPVYSHLQQSNKKPGQNKSVPNKNVVPKNAMKEKARINNFENKSKNPTQHLLQGEFVYKESKYDGVREIKHVHPKPRQISQEQYQKKQQEQNRVKIIEPELPPIEMRRRNEKKKSLKEQYLEEYKQLTQKEDNKDELIRKQQQYILTHDLEDNIFEMANKVAFHQYDQKKTDKKKEVEKTFGFEDQDSDQDLYADGIEAYNNARQKMMPDVLKNISKNNFASLINKQKQDKSSMSYSQD